MTPSLASGKLHPHSIYGMPLCCQKREPRVIPDLVTPSLQWSSSLPLSFEVSFVCLSNDAISLHTANMPKPPEYFVSDDISDRTRGKGVLSDLGILLVILGTLYLKKQWNSMISLMIF